jgi:hypothetical protein
VTPTNFKASKGTFVPKMELFPRNNIILALPSAKNISSFAYICKFGSVHMEKAYRAIHSSLTSETGGDE